MSRRFTTEEFIKKSKEVHKNKYDYSKSTYVTANHKLIIICPIHGDWSQRATDHLYGRGCRKCAKQKIEDDRLEYFFKKSKEVHGDKYDYSKIKEMPTLSSYVTITCLIHGDWEQRAYQHLRGNNCKKCFHQNRAFTTEEFIKKSKEIHGDKFIYDKAVYKNKRSKIKMVEA